MKVIELAVRLKADQVQAIRDGAGISLLILPPRMRRVEHLADDAAGTDMDRLIDYWNNSNYIRYDAIGESRHHRFEAIHYDRFKFYIRKAILEIGVKPLENMMDEYFDACRQGKHIWDGSNHGYSHVGGWVKKVLSDHGRNLKPWWKGKERIKIEDSYPELTKKIADMYAQKWLGRDKFDYEEDSGDHINFAKASEKVKAKAIKSGMSEEMLIVFLLDCVDSLKEQMGKKVTPAWLCSNKIWTNYLPQHLKAALGK